MRRLAAALACRIAGTRLYAKPLQLLDVESGVSVLDHMIALAQTLPVIDRVVLGISEGSGNELFVETAKRAGVGFIRGSESDVLSRLIQCGEKAEATDVFRVTTESPFFHYEMVEEVWKRHVENGNDVTAIDGLPEGSAFEIYTLESLRRSHARGDDRHRSELCSLYVREHRDEFKVEIVPVSENLRRLDLRLTIDYPEDLVLCRRVYEHFRSRAPRVPVGRIIEFLDADPGLCSLVAPYVVPTPLF